MKMALFIVGASLVSCILFALTIDWALERRPPQYCFDAVIWDSAVGITNTAVPLYAKMCTQR